MCSWRKLPSLKYESQSPISALFDAQQATQCKQKNWKNNFFSRTINCDSALQLEKKSFLSFFMEWIKAIFLCCHKRPRRKEDKNEDPAVRANLPLQKCMNSNVVYINWQHTRKSVNIETLESQRDAALRKGSFHERRLMLRVREKQSQCHYASS